MKKKNNQLLMTLSVMGLMAFTACVDANYDLSDLDTTIGIGSDEGFTLPTSSTKRIFLDDFLKLNDSESVVVKDNEEDDDYGDYVFLQKGDDVDPVHPSIDEVAISDGESTDIPVKIEISNLPADYDQLPTGSTVQGTANSISEEIQVFIYKDTHPEEITSLKTAETEGSVDINITFTEDMSEFISNFKTFEVEFPQYMVIDVKSTSQACEVSSNILKFKNVPTNKPLTIEAYIKKLYFTELDERNNLAFDSENITMKGNIKVDATYDDILKGNGNIDNLLINSTMAINDLTIVSGNGCFNPKIEMNDLGNVQIEDLPDFLTNEDVVIDLYNPQVLVNIESDLSVSGFMEGNLIAKKKDGTEISIDIPKLKINAAKENEGISNIMICRQEMDFSEYTDHQVVPKLADIIEALPYINTISFKVEAKVETLDESTFELGKKYTMQPSYSIETPIDFGKDARISYTDTLSGWNEGIQHFDFTNMAYVRVTANIENRIPAYLTISAHAIDVNGKKIDNLRVAVDSDIKASKDGINPEETPIVITIDQKDANALKAVDGIIFSIEAAASDGNNAIEGITLNAKKHSLLAKDIKVTLMGKVILKSDD